MKIVFMWCVAGWPCSYSWGMVVHVTNHNSAIASPAPTQQRVSEHRGLICPHAPVCVSQRVRCAVVVLDLI